MIILDTCTLLWLSEDPPRLPDTVMDIIRNTEIGHRFVSAITAFEIGVKYKKGTLKLPSSPQNWFNATISGRGLNVLSVTDRIAFSAARLKNIHKDPADRIIIATAFEYDLLIITADPVFFQYTNAKVKWK
jgi:PIN domain nuclease of toxin-antitoxin system